MKDNFASTETGTTVCWSISLQFNQYSLCVHKQWTSGPARRLLLNKRDDDDRYGGRQLLRRNEMHIRYVTRYSQAAAWWTSSGDVVEFHESGAVIQDSRLTYGYHVLTRSIPVLRRSFMVSRHVVCLWKNTIRMCNKKHIFCILMIVWRE